MLVSRACLSVFLAGNLLVAAQKLDCKNVAFGSHHYDLSALDHTMEAKYEEARPPSKMLATVYINPCGAVKGSQCPRNTQLCAVREAEVDGKRRVIEVATFGNSDMDGSVHVSRLDAGVQIDYDGLEWGGTPLTATLAYECASHVNITEVLWQGGVLEVHVETPAACEIHKRRPTPPPKQGWGFFSKLLALVAFLVLSYTALTFWVNYRGQQTAAFSLDSYTELARDLPYLVRGFVQKVADTFGRRRRGYTAL